MRDLSRPAKRGSHDDGTGLHAAHAIRPTSIRLPRALAGQSAVLNLPAFTHQSALLVRDVAGCYRPAAPAEVLQAALHMLTSQLRGTAMLSSPQVVHDFLRLRLGTLEHEVFAIICLDAKNRVIEYVEMFRGTVTQSSVYPREIVKETLARNAAGVILVHNHPSGIAEPSPADKALTQTLKNALALVDVRVLDHLIVAGSEVLSFAELRLL